jgi:hypothetical protein
MLKSEQIRKALGNFCSRFLAFIFLLHISSMGKSSKKEDAKELSRLFRSEKFSIINLPGKSVYVPCSHRRTCAFLPFGAARTSIASFLYQLYCQRECVCVR